MVEQNLQLSSEGTCPPFVLPSAADEASPAAATGDADGDASESESDSGSDDSDDPDEDEILACDDE